MKSIKILTFGNSYSNDAYAWLYEIFKSAGVEDVVLGHILNGGCNINNHWSNVSEDATERFGATYCCNDNGKAWSVGVNSGKSLREIYTEAISAYPWDYVVIQHGPKHVEKAETYSDLRLFLDFIKKRLTSEKTEFIYHMIWKYNDNVPGGSTADRLSDIYGITKDKVLKNPEFKGVIPAVTMRQNIMSSYLTDKDISRDYGHMSLGLGRYALGILWYCFFTGGKPNEVSFVPRLENVRVELLEKYSFDEILPENLRVAHEAIENALSSPFAVTPSRFTAEVADSAMDKMSIDEHIAAVHGEQVE